MYRGQAPGPGSVPGIAGRDLSSAVADEPITVGMRLLDVLGALQEAGPVVARAAERRWRPSARCVTPRRSSPPAVPPTGALRVGRGAQSGEPGVRGVEFHLGNVYRKLGVRSRRDLRASLPSA